MMKYKFLWALFCCLLMHAGAQAQSQTDSLLRLQVRLLADSVELLRQQQVTLLNQQQAQELRMKEIESATLPWVLAGAGILLGAVALVMALKAQRLLDETAKASARKPAPSNPSFQQMEELRGQFQTLKLLVERQQTQSKGQKQTEEFAQPQAEASGSMPSIHEEIGQTATFEQLPQNEAVDRAGAQAPQEPVYLQKPMADGTFMPYRESRGNASYFQLNLNDMSFALLADAEVFDRMKKTGLTGILPDAVAILQEGSMEQWKTLETIQSGKLASKPDGMLEVVEKLIYRTKN